MRLWPRSLAGRTGLPLVIGLVIVQSAGLAIHALDRMDLQRLAEARDVAIRTITLYRQVVLADPAQREKFVREMELPAGNSITLGATPPSPEMGIAENLDQAPVDVQRLVRVNTNFVPMPGPLRPREWVVLGGFASQRLVMGMHLPDGPWLTIAAPLPPPRFWHSPRFLAAFVLMTVAAALLALWAIRRLTSPVATLAAAARALGRDVNAPPLPETGPTEIALAAAAFNTMAARIRRFVRDRTEMLTAIGHDLRTPITRLKLRAEFMEDDEQRRKMLIDLDEMEAMVAATLAFGRDAARDEAVTALDLGAMLRTVIDEATDALPDDANMLRYDGPDHLTIRARPLGLKRALVNLVTNAIKYGGTARVNLLATTTAGMVRVDIDDDGPGVPADELDRVFEPFHRIEGSRSRETGGVGLGLPIARDILRAHGGDVTLANRPGGGARATVLLPA